MCCEAGSQVARASNPNPGRSKEPSEPPATFGEGLRFQKPDTLFPRSARRQ